jgi:5'(3')-deoxyribonucleotidase
MNTKIAIDVDEVLVPFLSSMAKFYGKTINKSKYSYVYRDIFNVTEEESQKMVREFYASETFSQLIPIKGAQNAMFKLRGYAKKMYVITGRHDVAREETELWIDQHFPGIFDDVILTNSYTPLEIKKSDICHALNIGLIIDDNMGICNECMASGTRAINFVGEEVYPWCEESEISIREWEELL